jgi:hypothetical protein
MVAPFQILSSLLFINYPTIQRYIVWDIKSVTKDTISLPPKISLSFGFSDKNFVSITYVHYTCYMLFPSHPPSFNLPNNTQYKFRNIETLHFYRNLSSCLFLSHEGKYSLRLPVFKHFQITYIAVLWDMTSCSPLDYVTHKTKIQTCC